MEINIYEAALIPVISGLVQVYKQLGLPIKYSSLISIVLGLLFGIIYIEPFDLKNGMLIGLILGLSASGFYSGTKSIQETIKSNHNEE